MSYLRTLELASGIVNPCACVAPVQMIVHETHGLHERIDGRRSDEPPPAPFEILRERLGLGGDGQLGQRCTIQPLLRLSAARTATRT